jgi:hypothetical protein
MPPLLAAQLSAPTLHWPMGWSLVLSMLVRKASMVLPLVYVL